MNVNGKISGRERGRSKRNTAGFQDTLSRVRYGGYRLEHNGRFVAKRWEALEQTVRDLNDRGIHVILYFPPLAPTVWRELNANRDRYPFIEELKKRIAGSRCFITDTMEPANHGAMDCEFYDGFHPGEVATARMLLHLVARMNNGSVAIQEHVIRETISRYQGSVAVPGNFWWPGLKEADFLGLNCKK